MEAVKEAVKQELIDFIKWFRANPQYEQICETPLVGLYLKEKENNNAFKLPTECVNKLLGTLCYNTNMCELCRRSNYLG